jgi:hypothetical protein
MFSSAQIQSLPSADINMFTNEELGAITTSAMGGMTLAQVNGLGSDRARMLSAYQIAALTDVSTDFVKTRFNTLYA